MRRLRFLSQLAAACFLLCSSALIAQGPAVAPRILSPIEESSLTTLTGSVPLLARAEFDLGAAPASTQLTHIRLVLSRSIEQEAALDKFMAEQQDKSSPNYHKWLTPEQFGKLYGPADSDIAAIVGWLESKGLKVETVSTGRTNIAFFGTVIQVEAAFHTSIHSFDVNGEQFTSNVTNPKIPAALGNVVAGIASLNTIRPRAHHVGGALGKFDPDLGRMVPVESAAMDGPKPQLTTGSAGKYSLFVVPGDAATIYNSPNNHNFNFGIGTNYTGQGVTIGIGGNSVIKPSTVVSYRSRFLGDTTPPLVTNVDNGTNTTDQDEAYIDTELSGALAPGAAIHFYISTDLVSAIDRALTDNEVDIFSLSYGACELQNTTGGNAALNGWWQQAATQGIAVAVSTGDNGSAACDDPGSLNAAVSGLAVSGFASTPYNIAVGGTDFNVLLTNFTGYVNPSNSANTFWRTALSYIPESTWNNSSQVNGKISANIPFLNSTGSSNIVAGSGGVSTCSTNSTTNSGMGTCTHGYAKPSWQRGPQVPADGARDLPDVSLMSGSGFDTAAWLVCTDRTGTVGGVAVTADCSTQSNGMFYFGGYGGTSTAAPAFAGILAMVQQKTASRLGQAAKDLYDLYNGAHASQIFHDTVVGNISVPCGVNTANCVQNAAGSYFLTGYDTTTGYDLATGLGSVDASALVAYWGSTSANATATVTVTLAVSAISVGDILKVTVSVAGSGSLATPTGTVNLSGGGYLSPVQTLSAGSYTFTVPANSLFGGSDTLTVSYSGDNVYAPGMGTAVVTVSKLTPTVTVQPNQASYPANIIVFVGVTVSGPGPTPTGLLQLTGPGYTSSPCILFAGVCSFDIPDNTLASATDTLTATYSGDPFYTAAVGTASIKVSYLIPTVTATPSATNISAASSLQVVAHVTGTGAAPGGYVQLIGGGWGSGMVLLSGGSYTFTIPPMTLTTRSDLFIMSYFGDSVYAATNATLTVVVTQLPAAVTVTPASTSMNSGQSLNVIVAVAGVGGAPTGAVTLSGGGYTSVGTLISPTTGSNTFTIPPNSLTAGLVTFTASYTGDNYFSAATGTSVPVTVTASAFGLAASTPAAVSKGGSASSTITVSSTAGYAGSVSLACVLATSPAGVVNAPSCSVSGGSPVALSSSAMSGTATVTIGTTAATAQVQRPGVGGWAGAGGGAVLAFLVLLGIPARRRNWPWMLALLVVSMGSGSMAGCGGGGGGGGGGGTPGTTAGTYTFTVTGTGTPVVTPAPTATITLTVN